MPHSLRLAGLLAWFFAPAFLYAQSPLRFERLSLEQGVSHDLVFAIHQDRQGFMWFGTMYGLVKYDGRRYTIYKHDPADSNSISFNDIIALHEDRAGDLWIGTWGGGLNRFNPATEKFTRFMHDAQDTNSVRDNIVWTIAEDQSGNLWIGTQSGLDKLVAAHGTNRFQHYRLPAANAQSAMNHFVRVIRVDKAGRVWIGATNGLFCIAVESGRERIRHFRHAAHDSAGLSDDHITAIYQDRDDNLWIGTANGLNKMIAAPKTEAGVAFQHYRHEAAAPFSLSNNHIGPICEDREGALWIGTGRGLNRFDRAAQKFMRFQHDPADPHSLRTNSVVALHADSAGIVWVGTYFGGVHKLVLRGAPFVHVRHQPGNEASLSGGGVRAFYQEQTGAKTLAGSEASAGILWIGTFGSLQLEQTAAPEAQATQSSARKNNFLHYRANPKSSSGLRSNLITALAGDRSHHIWVGTQNGGLTQIDAARRMVTYRHQEADSSSLSSNNVICLYLDRAGDLWIGTDNGLNKLDRNRRRFVRYQHAPGRSQSLSDNLVHTIFEDHSGALWLGTYRGLNRFDRQTNTFRHYRHDLRDPQSLSNDYVYALHEDRAGNFWVGTSDGLNHFNRATESFKVYREKEGLPNGVICGILEDRLGRLWLSTNKGLSCFDPQTAVFKNYDTGDGLQSNMFSVGACYQDREGLMYFGGINGYNYFRPEWIQREAFKPPVALTAVKIFEQPVSSLQRSSGELVLPHHRNFLSFEFAALSFAQPEKNRYAYRLEGVDRDWVFAGPKNSASYTNVPPGRYHFRVKAANHDGVWNEKEARFAFVITPPFWRRWWFYALVLSAVIFFVLFWHRRRLQSERERVAEIESIKSKERLKRFQEVEQARLEEREAVRKKIAADFHDESGHKLTKISLFCGVLQSKLRLGASEIEVYLERIMKAAASLHKDLSDFIWSLDPAENTLHDTALKLKEFGDQLFDHTGIRFDMQSLAPELEQAALPMEMRQNLTCIFKEGMNNILKHNRAACQNVKFAMARDNGHFNVTLSDDGKGFDLNECPAGHGLRNMQQRAAAIGGELEIFSVPGKGTTIHFKGKLLPSPFVARAHVFTDWHNGTRLN